MFTLDTCCTLVPYFEVQDGQLDAFKALARKLVAKTRTEPGCMHYAFSFSGNVAHCREGYVDAAAVLAHRENVAELLGQALKIAKIVRFEVHAPEAEIDKLRGPMASRNPQFFALEEGIRRSSDMGHISKVAGSQNERQLKQPEPATFGLGDRVRKKSGAAWQGCVVGWYSTTLTPEGYAVESEAHPGSVQIYPVAALERVA